MQELEKRLRALKDEFLKAYEKLGIAEKVSQASQLEQEVAEPEIWRDVARATAKNQELARLNEEVEPWEFLRTQLDDLDELMTMGGEDLKEELAEQIGAMEGKLTELKKALRFQGPYDSHNAILRITSGAGGTEAMDWAGMLERMYLRFAERKGFKINCLERVTGEEAGIKTAVYEIVGSHAYGWLKSEHGVHRLVRLSPFNADHLRQTS